MKSKSSIYLIYYNYYNKYITLLILSISLLINNNLNVILTVWGIYSQEVSTGRVL